MKSIISLVGILLIIFGIASFGYNDFTYTKREKVAEIGDVQVTANTQKTVYFPPAASGIAIVAGIILVALGRLR